MTAPYYQDEQVTVLAGDCLEVMADMPAESVHAIVTDPPYGLEFMGKSWDSFRATGNFGGGGIGDVEAYKAGGGDGRRSTSPVSGRPRFAITDGRAFGDWCELWTAECLRVLKPGGHMLAFGGTRTWHRLAVAVEDAGFEIRDSIAWLYGSGFPKSLDVSKAIDKRPGVMRHPEFGKALRDAMTAKGYTNTFDVAEKVIGRRTGAVANWVKYQFPEAKWWPALRDLLDMDEDTWGPVIAEAERQKIGTKAGTRLAIAPGQGEDRSPLDLDVTDHATDAARQWQGWGTALKPAFEPIVVARKPLTGTVAANVLEHGTGALNVDACRVEMSEADREAARVPQPVIRKDNYTVGGSDGRNGDRFEPAPAGRWPTNVALDDTQAAELDKQSGETRDGVAVRRNGVRGGEIGPPGAKPAGTPDQGYGGQGGASRFFPTFRYEPKAPTEERPRVNGIAHPTVKPLDLMRWLVRLVTPPGGVVLDPFAGSGTTLEAALIEGFQCIGIEREADYLPLIKARITKPIETVLDLGGIA